MNLLPQLPLHLSAIALFGITLLLGLIGGEIARRIPYLPVISGYIAVGFLLGPGGFNIVNNHVLDTASVFVEISLSLILFELGRNLDFRWLYHDKGLLLMAIAESSLTFIAIYLFTYHFIGLDWLQSSFAGTIAMATSPAVVMLVANDLSSAGPVTRRTLCLTSANNLLALVMFTLLLPLAQAKTLTIPSMIIHSLYRVAGSFLLAFAMYFITEMIAKLIVKNRENHFILFIGLVTLTTNLANIFHLSTMLALLSLGIISRNIDRKHLLMEVDFSWLSKLFFILLFVVVGVHLQLQGLWKATLIVSLFILIRALAKASGIFVLSKVSKLTYVQSFAISLALLPMAEISIGMSNILTNYSPSFGSEFLLIVTSVLTVLYVIGPIATQCAFIFTKESITQIGSFIAHDNNTVRI